MNVFVLGREEMHGVNHGRIALRSQAEVTGLTRPVPYMITEFNGHMHPTKRADPEQRQAEHVTRYLQVLNATYGDPQIAGSIGWCMADYNTHKDFGSGDRVCHHGVTDIFRIPKFAAAVYASQGDPEGGIVLEPVTYWARGERNIGGVLPMIVLTNCDEIELRYGDGRSKRIGPDFETYPHLPHPPVIIDHRAFSADELGRWGMQWQDATVAGYRNGEEVVSVRLAAAPVPALLEVKADDLALLSSEKDAVRVTVRALDQVGRLLPYLDDPIVINVSGAARLIGPSTLTLRGGATGFWVETTGVSGKIDVSVSSPRFTAVDLEMFASTLQPQAI
jgi:beta-galactosidase